MAQLVHQGDVEVPLGVLDDLGGFRLLDGGGAVHPGLHHGFVQGGHALQGICVVCRDHLDDSAQGCAPCPPD